VAYATVGNIRSANKNKNIRVFNPVAQIKFRRRLALRDSFWEIGKIG